MKLESKSLIAFATCCFAGTIIIQVFWIISSYEGELATINKQKEQFTGELQHTIKNTPQLRTTLYGLLANHQQPVFDDNDKKKILSSVNVAILKVKEDSGFGLPVERLGIFRHKRIENNNTDTVFEEVALQGKKIDRGFFLRPDTERICLSCALTLNNHDKNKDHNHYELIIGFGATGPMIYKKLLLLALASLFFLSTLVWLFLLIHKRFRQEKRLATIKNDFIDNLTHEIQTPLFAIQMANRLIKEKGNSPEINGLITIIEKETGQLKNQAKKILGLAKLETEHLQLDLKKTDLNQLINEKMDTLRLLAAGKNGQVEFIAAQPGVYATVDAVHFNNILLSIVENSVKYNESRPVIKIKTIDQGRYAKLIIQDNGIGIPKEHQPHVFDKFYRVPVENKKHTSGFGLGLSYAKRIIAMHGGTITLDSEPGTGTIVSIEFPK